jgi:molybdopterin-synthase adenylyltransferase
VDETDHAAQVLREVADLGLLDSPRLVTEALPDEYEGIAALEGALEVNGQSTRVWLVLDESFPLSPPKIFLRPWDALGVVPHVDARGFVCYAQTEGLVLDWRRPLSVVQEALRQARQVLSDGVSGSNLADFALEFEAYWDLLKSRLTACSLFEPTGITKPITVVTEQAGEDKLMYIVDGPVQISSYWNEVVTHRNQTIQHGLYVPLAEGSALRPPRHDRPFWRPDEVRRNLSPYMSEQGRRTLQTMGKHTRRRTEYVVIGVPRPVGGETLVGLRFEGVRKRHPLLEGGIAGRVVPMTLVRRDRSYLIRRGGGDAGFDTKHVLIIGCGAVGAHVAIQLAQAGILRLAFVDHDILNPENTFRHVLGRQHWGEAKVDALAQQLKCNLPYAAIAPVQKRIQRAIADGTIVLTDFDLVIMATGAPTVELWVNEQIRAAGIGAPAALFTWVEPLGIGGHALLTDRAAGPGCFECLYTPPSGGHDSELHNRAAFAAPDQSFARAFSGCATLHTPFAATDAVSSATLATRVAVAQLAGREHRNALLSWRGDAAAFLAEGFRLSPRYGLSDLQLMEQEQAFSSPYCRLCGTLAVA